ncbi:hypothetical protein [Streptomyces violaceusniger]
MTTPTMRRPAKDTGTDRPVPRWAEIVAHLIPLVGLPQCIWRLPFAFGFTMGSVESDPTDVWWAVPYIFGLSVLSESFALLSFGLVRGWGEVVPHWIPVLGGRRIPPFAVIVPAALGGLFLTGMLVYWALATFQIGGVSHVAYTNGWWDALATTCIGLLTLWGPLLLALTYAYYRRRGPGS